MTIPMISPIDPSVGQNLAEISQAIGNFVKPNLKFEYALRDALAANPALIQQIGNLNARSPEAVRGLYGGQVAEYFNKVGQSPEDKASIAQSTLQATAADATSSAMAAMTPEQRQQAASTGAFSALSGGKSQEDVELDSQRAKGRQAYQAFISANPALTPQEIVNRIRNRNGGITPDVAQGAFNSAAGPLYQRLLADAQDADRMRLQESLANARERRQVETARDQTVEILARQLMSRGTSGSIDAWKEIVQNGRNSPAIKDAFAKEQDKRNEKETALVEAVNNFDRLNRQDRVAAVLPTLSQIRQQINTVGATQASTRLNSEEKSNQLEAITTSLNTSFSAAGLPIRAHFIPYVDRIGPFNQKPSISYVQIGADGKETPLTDAQVGQVLGQVEVGVVTPEQSAQSPKVNAAIAAINAGTASLADVASATQYTAEEKAAIRAAFADRR